MYYFHLTTIMLFAVMLLQPGESLVAAGYCMYSSPAIRSSFHLCLSSSLPPQPGDNLVAAGYCMYSSSTIMVFTMGDGVNGFTLDPTIGEFVLTHENIQVPKRGKVSYRRVHSRAGSSCSETARNDTSCCACSTLCCFVLFMMSSLLVRQLLLGSPA